jgi:putative membrane protein
MRWELLLLLVAANATPALVGRLAGPRWAWPIDVGLHWIDGERLLGSHKTWRGLASSMAACSLVASAVGLPVATGAAFGAAAMLGDLLSAFVKRRLRLGPGREALGLDQVPEAALPLLLLWAPLGVTVHDVAVIVPTFSIAAMFAARAFAGAGRRPPDVDGAARPGSIAPVLLAVFGLVWLGLALAPRYRQDWLLENMLVFGAAPWLIHKWRVAPFSNAAYACLFVFFTLHVIGAHYTYSEVPYEAWWQAAFGGSLNGLLGWERNNYDRVVHFLYGLLVGPAAVELIGRATSPRGLWRWLLPWTFLCSHSVVYEMIEWSAALVFGGDLGVAYLGTQGDVWDAQKDMALAASGAALSVAAVTFLRRRPGPSPSASPASPSSSPR